MPSVIDELRECISNKVEKLMSSFRVIGSDNVAQEHAEHVLRDVLAWVMDSVGTHNRFLAGWNATVSYDGDRKVYPIVVSFSTIFDKNSWETLHFEMKEG